MLCGKNLGTVDDNKEFCQMLIVKANDTLQFLVFTSLIELLEEMKRHINLIPYLYKI